MILAGSIEMDYGIMIRMETNRLFLVGTVNFAKDNRLVLEWEADLEGQGKLGQSNLVALVFMWSFILC